MPKKKQMGKIPGGCTLWARQTIESDIFANKPDKWFKIWFYLVSRVNHTDNKSIRRGQCHLSYENIMLQCGATKSEVDHCIRWLKDSQMLETQKATRGFVVTIANYNRYQDLERYRSDSNSGFRVTDEGTSATGAATQKSNETPAQDSSYEPPGGAKSDSSGDTKGIQKGQDKQECNNEEKPPTSGKYPPTSDEYKLSALLLGEIQKRKPNIRKPDLQKWAVYIDRLIRIDKRTSEQIEKVIRWCQGDLVVGEGKWTGWANIILSTENLREKFDKLELKMDAERGKTIPIKPVETGADGLTPLERVHRKKAKHYG